MASGPVTRRWHSDGVRLLRQSGVIVLARIGGAVFALGFTMIMSRSMGAEGLGEVSAAMALALLLGLACTGNIEAGGVRFMVHDIAAGHWGRVRGFMRFSSHVVWGMSALIVALALTLAIWTDRGWPVCLAILSAPLLAWLRLGTGFAMGLSRPVLASLPGSALRPFLFFLAIALWVLLSGGITPPTAMTLFLLTIPPVLIVQWRLVRRAVRGVIPGDVTPQTGPRRTWLGVSLTLGLSVMFVEYSVYIAVLAASAVLGPAQLALLDVALKLTILLKFGVVAITQVFQPQLSRAMALGDRDAVRRCLGLSGCLRFGVLIVALVLAAGAGRSVLALFGPDFVAAYPVLLLLMLDPVATVVLGPVANVVSFSDRPRALLPALVPGLAGLILGALVLGGIWGLWGVALAYVGARVCWLGWLGLVCLRRLGIDPTIFGSLGWLRQSHRQG